VRTLKEVKEAILPPLPPPSARNFLGKSEKSLDGDGPASQKARRPAYRFYMDYVSKKYATRGLEGVTKVNL